MHARLPSPLVPRGALWLRFDPGPNREPFPALVCRISGTGTRAHGRPSPPVVDVPAVRWSLPFPRQPAVAALRRPGSIPDPVPSPFRWAVAPGRFDSRKALVRVCGPDAWGLSWVDLWKRALPTGAASASAARSRPAMRRFGEATPGSERSVPHG